MYDFVTPSQSKFQSLRLFPNPPGEITFFIAIENCGFETANYALAPSLAAYDAFPPTITNAFFMKKDLYLIGFLPQGVMVFLDNEPQETIPGSPNSDFNGILIIKKAKKKIAHHQTVIITLKYLGGCPPSPFAFTRN